MDTKANTAVALIEGFDVMEFASDNVQDVTHRVGVIQDEEGNDVSGFVIVGKNSVRYQDIQHTLRAEGIMRASRRKSALDASTEEGASLVVKALVSNEQRTAQAVIVDWFGFNQSGSPLSFDEDLVKVMLTKKPLWKDMVLRALDNDGNFTKR